MSLLQNIVKSNGSLLIVSELVVDMSLRRLVCSEELLEFLSCVHCNEGVNISFHKGDLV